MNTGSDIIIRDIAGNAKQIIGLNPDFAHTKELMKQNSISVQFNLPEMKNFVRGDYIEYEGEKFILRKNCQPSEENLQEYRYELMFEGTDMQFQDFIMFYTMQGLKESEWTLTSHARDFMVIALENIRRYFNDDSFVLGDIIDSDIQNISFDADTVFDSLAAIAETFECDWYLNEKTLNLVPKYEFGDPVVFEREVTVSDITRSGDNDAEYCTRLYALGSTRNIPKNYRTAGSGDVVDAIVQKRLRLPVTGGDYIDAIPNMKQSEILERVVRFDDIYPRRVGEIESVSTVECPETNEDTGEKTKWNAYRFTDPGIVFKQEYILPNQELRILFQSGNLNGFDFAVRFNPLNKPETESGSQVFEIIRADDYGIPLPNDTLKPNAGDKYVLYGFDVSLVGDQYVPAAEQELYEAALDWLSENQKDTGVYECSSIIQYFYDNKFDLQIGKNIHLVNGRFTAGYRSSRIIGFEKKLINKYDAVYKVGDKTEVKRISAIENEVKKQAEIIESNTNQSLQNRKNAIRNTQNLRALKGLIFDPDGYFDTTHIKPNSIETMYLAVGAKSQDFTTSGISIKTYKDGADFRAGLSTGYINHRSLWWGSPCPSLPEGEGEAPEDATKYTWRVTADFNRILQDNTATYYMYVKAERLSDVAEWHVSPEQIMFSDDPNYYYFLMGVIYPVKEDRRDISLTNGMAYISGGTIYGDTIKSINYTEDDTNEGSKYDLNTGSIRIGNKIKGLLFDAANKVFKLFGITLEFRNEGNEIVTQISEDGSALFAKGNVVFEKDGNVRVSGAIINSFSYHDYSNMTSEPWNVRTNLTSFNHHYTFKMGYAPTLILPNDIKYAGATATFVGGFMVSGHPIIQEKGYTFNGNGDTTITLRGNVILRLISIPQIYEDACQWILIDSISLGSLLP